MWRRNAFREERPYLTGQQNTQNEEECFEETASVEEEMPVNLALRFAANAREFVTFARLRLAGFVIGWKAENWHCAKCPDAEINKTAVIRGEPIRTLSSVHLYKFGPFN